MTAWPFFILPLAALAAGGAQPIEVGDPLPPLRAEFLSGRKANLPEAASGKVALLLFGFTYDSRHAVEAWAARFRARLDSNPRVTFYEIPVIGGMARLGKWFIDSGMRRGTPKADHEHVITVYGGSDEWKRRVGFQAPDAAYLILLDPSGKVAWKHAGGFDESAFEALSAAVGRLAAN